MIEGVFEFTAGVTCSYDWGPLDEFLEENWDWDAYHQTLREVWAESHTGVKDEEDK